MRKRLIPLAVLAAVLPGTKILAANSLSQARAAEPALTGRWTVTADFHGTPIYVLLDLKQEGSKLSGEINGDKLEGTLEGNALHFLAKDERGGTQEAKGTVQGDTITGTVVLTDADDREHPSTHEFTAKRVPQRRTGAPQRHDFTPTVFYRQFSPMNKPVLTVSPGDTIHTTTVDAGGTDEKSVTRVLGGNPETGPFFIETAVPGDTLAVHLTR